jgi:hypothetical protein
MKLIHDPAYTEVVSGNKYIVVKLFNDHDVEVGQIKLVAPTPESLLLPGDLFPVQVVASGKAGLVQPACDHVKHTPE